MKLRDARRTQAVATPYTVSAPVGGWNTRDNQAVMPETDAQLLENFFPESDYIRLRKGNQEWSTGLSGVGRTIYTYTPSGNMKLLGFSGGHIYDCSVQGPATSLKSGFGSDFWSTVTMGNKGLFFNGIDVPQQYDGAAVTDNAFTGPSDPKTLKFAHVHKERLFLWEENSLVFWYGANKAITGALQSFDLSLVRSLGGHIVAMGSLTYDSGSGVDDTLAIFLACGEVLLYQGSDPGDATNWALQGDFKIGCVLGPRSVQQFGGDLVVMTEQGFFPLSAAITGKNLSDAVTISDKINPSVEAAAKSYAGRDLWQFTLFTAENMLIANIPTDEKVNGIDQFVQYVMNTRTGAWTLFTGWSAGAFTVIAGQLYYIEERTQGSESRVYRAEVGTSDYGQPRMGVFWQAYTGLGDWSYSKVWTMARTVFSTEGNTPISLGLAVDYELFPRLDSVPSGDIGNSKWDVAKWDVAPWAGAIRQQIQWRKLGRKGHVGALAGKLSSATQVNLRYYGATYLSQRAGQPLG